MATPENGTSRQRVVRIPLIIDDWIQKRVRKVRVKDPDSRIGIATEINSIIQAAYEADVKKPD